MIKKILLTIASVLLFILSFILVIQAVTPKYRFSPASKFSGDYIYNPYWHRVNDSLPALLKGNFHAHTMWDTRHDYNAQQYTQAYRDQGYNVIGIADHQTITEGGTFMPTYEHGFNFSNYHILALGADGVQWLDYPIMLEPLDQMQASVNLLKKDTKALAINHSERIRYTDTKPIFARLQGYNLMEMNPQHDPACWDIALSSGIYSNLIANDDAHSIKNRLSWFQKCYSMVFSDSAEPDSVLNCLLGGAAYGVVISNEKNSQSNPHAGIARITDIGLHGGDTVYISLDQSADSIRFIGQNGRVMQLNKATDNAAYHFAAVDTYIRIESYFPLGVVLWSNPFVRVDSTLAAGDATTDTDVATAGTSAAAATSSVTDGAIELLPHVFVPQTVVPAPTVNWFLTALNTLKYLALASLLVWLATKLLKIR